MNENFLDEGKSIRNTEDEKKSTNEEVINLTTGVEMLILRSLFVSKIDSNHETTHDEDDCSKHIGDICFHKVQCNCEYIGSGNLETVSFGMEQDRTMFDISCTTGTNEDKSTVEPSGENEKENCTINIAEDTIVDYLESLQPFDVIDQSTDNSKMGTIVELTYSECSNTSQVKSNTTLPAEADNELEELIMLWKKCQNLYDEKESKQQNSRRDVYFGSGDSKKEKENTQIKHHKDTASEKAMGNEIHEQNIDDDNKNKKVNVSNESKAVTVRESENLSFTNCSEFSQVENPILTHDEESEIEEDVNVLLGRVQNINDKDKQEEFGLGCISTDICNEHNALQTQKKNTEMKCQDNINGKEITLQENEIINQNTDPDKEINVRNEQRECEVIDLRSADRSCTFQIDDTIELSSEEEDECEQSIILLETGTENVCNRDKQNPISTISKPPMDDKKGEFFIDKELVPVCMYQDGLSQASWNPTQVLYEICSQCQWSRPEFSLFHFDIDKGFLFSVRIQEHTFVPEKRSETKKQAKHYASAHFLTFLGFKFTFGDLKSVTDPSSTFINKDKWKYVNKRADCRNQPYKGNYCDSEKENYKYKFTERPRYHTSGKYLDTRHKTEKKISKNIKHQSDNRHRSYSRGSMECIQSENGPRTFHSETNKQSSNKTSTAVMPVRHNFNPQAHEFTPHSDGGTSSYYQNLPPLPFSRVPAPRNPQAPPLPYHRLPPPHCNRLLPLPNHMIPRQFNFDPRNVPSSECGLHRPVYLFL